MRIKPSQKLIDCRSAWLLMSSRKTCSWLIDSRTRLKAAWSASMSCRRPCPKRLSVDTRTAAWDQKAASKVCASSSARSASVKEASRERDIGLYRGGGDGYWHVPEPRPQIGQPGLCLGPQPGECKGGWARRRRRPQQQGDQRALLGRLLVAALHRPSRTSLHRGGWHCLPGACRAGQRR